MDEIYAWHEPHLPDHVSGSYIGYYFPFDYSPLDQKIKNDHKKHSVSLLSWSSFYDKSNHIL